MAEETRKLTVGITRGHGAVDNIDVGPLFSELSVEPHELSVDTTGEYYSEGSVEVSLQRTHEWEYVIEIVIAGAAYDFGKSMITALGSRFRDWIEEETEDESQANEIKISIEGGDSIAVEIGEIEEATEEIVNLFDRASEEEQKVTIEFPR
jgi:hypothetical protein